MIEEIIQKRALEDVCLVPRETLFSEIFESLVRIG